MEIKELLSLKQLQKIQSVMDPTAAMPALFRIARGSPMALRMINPIMLQVVPFNRPHGLRITRLGLQDVEIELPFRRSNLNHLGSLHALALADLAEYTSGVSLLNHINPKIHRLILKSFKIEYFKQGRTRARGRGALSLEDVQNQVLLPLQTQDSIEIEIPITVQDTKGNDLCKAHVLWQIKPWSRVKKKS